MQFDEFLINFNENHLSTSMIFMKNVLNEEEINVDGPRRFAFGVQTYIFSYGIAHVLAHPTAAGGNLKIDPLRHPRAPTRDLEPAWLRKVQQEDVSPKV